MKNSWTVSSDGTVTMHHSAGYIHTLGYIGSFDKSVQKYIVNAVNSHEALVRDLALAISYLKIGVSQSEIKEDIQTFRKTIQQATDGVK